MRHEQRLQLGRLLESGTLRNHALAVLADMYDDARGLAADETGLPAETFPAACPWDLDAVLEGELGDATWLEAILTPIRRP